MRFKKRYGLLLIGLMLGVGLGSGASESNCEEAWSTLPSYRYGDDFAPLLAIDRAVIQAMDSPESQAAIAARLAALLAQPDTTAAARQYICLQLRQAGTAAEAPVLAGLLTDPQDGEMARHALEAIAGPESLAALREALASAEGPLQIGLIHSLGARRDAEAVPALEGLASEEDASVAEAALGALGKIGSPRAADYLQARAEQAEMPWSRPLARAMLRAAESLAAAEQETAARAIFGQLGDAEQEPGSRRAGWSGWLELQAPEARAETILDWFTGDDPDRRRVAAARIRTLTDAQIEAATERLEELSEAGMLALIQIMADRRGEQALPMVLELADSERPELQAAAVRALGQIGDTAAIPRLVTALTAGGAAGRAAREALAALPRDDVGRALLQALDERPEARSPVIEVLDDLTYYPAIDPLIELARQDDPGVYQPALQGLRGIADPDEHDIPRLLALLWDTPAGARRDDVERTILIVSDKLPADADRAGPVLAALADTEAEPADYLPLLGRLGGPGARQRIDTALESDDAETREAAVRGLCNWPNAEVAEPLREIAASTDNPTHQRWALRAFTRVVSLPSERPEAETLAMLRDAMQMARHPDDRQLILQRAGAVRTMESVEWLAGFLDDEEVNQAACQALVELAHHRFLRQPNRERFAPILEKVAQITEDRELADRAQRYRLGL